MLDRIKKLEEEIEQYNEKAEKALEDWRIRLLGKKGEITQLFEEFKTVGSEQKREFGQRLNTLKNKAIDKIVAIKEEIENQSISTNKEDKTRPSEVSVVGSRHPISLVKREISSI